MRLPVVLKTRRHYQPPGSVYYEVASNGLFQVRTTKHYRAVTPVVGGVPGLLPSATKLELFLPPVPAALLEEVLAFFREAYRRYDGEAMVVLFFGEGGEFRVGVPLQTIPGYRDASGVFRASRRLEYGVVERPEGFLRLGTIHSHADFSAYASAVDCLDEQYEDGLHVVFGHVHREQPSRSACFVANGVRFPLRPEDVLESCAVPQRAPRPDWMRRLRTEESASAQSGAPPIWIPGGREEGSGR